MRRALLTFGLDEPYRRISLMTAPLMLKYAARHGYDFIMPNSEPESLQYYKHRDVYRQKPSWLKVIFIAELLADYDTVLWLDSDIVVQDMYDDIDNSVDRDSLFGISLHQADPYGRCPNCGVWLVRGSDETCELLGRMMSRNPADHPLTFRTWEQGALILEMGGGSDPNGSPVGFPVVLPEAYPFKWTELGQRWNASTADTRGIPSDAVFVHCSYRPKDKVEWIRNVTGAKP